MKKLTLLLLGAFLIFTSCEKDSLEQQNKKKPNQFETFDAECGDCDGKLNFLELLYNGDDFAEIIVETKKDGTNGSKIVFNQFLEPATTFSFVGNDKKGTLGTQISIYINGVLNTTLHTSCSVPVGPGLVFGSFEVINGASRNGGALCPVETTSTPSDCGECDGKINFLELLYNGNQGAIVVVKTKKAGLDGSKIVFNEFIEPGSTFSFIGNDKKGTLGTQISIYINGVLNTTLHTSCSVPVGPGLVIGDFEVVTGSSRNGGELCPEETIPSDGCECVGKIVKMIVIYDGPANATVSVGSESDGSNPIEVFYNVQPGDVFPVILGNVGDWWYYSVNGNVDASIFTNCSDNILGNDNAIMSDFGSLGTYPNPIQNTDNATFFIYSYTDSENSNTCTATLG